MGTGIFAAVGVDFSEWLARDRDPRTVRDYLNYYSKLRVGECGCDFTCLSEKAAATTTNWGRKLVRLYARWCWERGALTYDQLMRIRATAKLKRAPYRPIPPAQVEKEPRVLGWLRPYIHVLYYSGIRLSEVVYIAGKRFRIYDIGDNLGFIDVWYIRGKKKLYEVFAPIPVLEAIAQAEVHPYNYVKIALKRAGIKASLYRKHFFQKCTSVAPLHICDFYQSRIKIVGAKHYETLLTKAIDYYPEVVKALDQTTYAVLRARAIVRILRERGRL